ncbi:pyridoxal-phosphate dependent enzyme [Roseobacter sp. YSTF-M11]|uniref:Pyridoxal-phosphate dependent enzyme n=1 Tax=Roseobacter insulae TaxID=2859783 RepID=A0A9X1FUY0_9RHOB|nr:pyridoxal-phosphate dependent enzyme [Roseobacter insulae]MBW4708112.1 pyridoxal-phosphate dependent enzyme [Roseobacter insulae]
MMTDTPLLDPAPARALLSVCPAYVTSPLIRTELASMPLWIKDETNRMGLGAFKALGGVYAVARLIEHHLEQDLAPDMFVSDHVRARAATLTFVCASAGNHGMAVAAGARVFGARCRIHLAETVPEDFATRLKAKGATVVRSGSTYEQSVQAAIADAEETGALHLADGSWPGYTEPPRLVMEGYTVLAEEMRESLEASGDWPSHVYLQAGVGGLAAAVAYMIRQTWAQQPEIVVVEPDAAPCLRDSVAASRLVTVAGPVSNMGRLDCKTPSMLACDILSGAADRFVTISDQQALDGVRAAHKLGCVSTPSGAAGLSALLLEQDPPPHPLVILSEGPVQTG